jgi:hypothetical protein
MAIAPQNLMSKLRGMEDSELAQYAATNKNDPFIFPLAFQESQDRKRLRTAKDMQAAGQEPPKVVDQSLAEMMPQMQAMPEDQGIAQLSAPNMESINMAGGGIIAFDEGGEVPRFQSQGYVKYPYGTVGAQPQGLYDIPGLTTGQPFAEQQPGDAALQERIARIQNLRTSQPQKDALIAQAREEFGLPKVTTIPPTTPVQFSDKPAATTPTTQGTSPLIDKDKSVVDKAVERKRLEDDAAARGEKLPAEPGLPSLNAAMKQYEGTVYKNSPDKETIQKEFADIDKPLLAKMQANIDKESSRLKSDKEQDFYMSLIQGGLAAAAESGPNALQNIAKGFATGAGSYAGALKDFRKATQENAKAETELARYEATGKKDALKSYNEQIAKRDDRYAQGVAGIIQQNMASSASLSAAKIGRDSMGEYRNASQVETIRKNIDAKLGDDPAFKFNAAARAAEVERRLQLELQRYPNLAQYAGPPTTGSASGASNQGWGQAKVVQ